MNKRIIVNWKRYQEDQKFFLFVEGFIFHGWRLVFVDRERP